MKARFLFGLAGMVMAGALSAAPIISEEITHFSFSGTFKQDDNVALFRFDLLKDAVEPVYIVTYGYGGGVSAVGNKTVAQGGFDPVISLFSSLGSLIDYNILGEEDCMNNASAVGGQYGNPYLPPGVQYGLMFDACLSISNMAKGTYFVGLAQSPNLIDEITSFNPITVTSWFAGQGNFTADFCSGSGSSFCDLYGNQRSNRWAMDILNVNYAVQLVPAPVTIVLVLLGLLGLRRYLPRAAA